MSIVYCLKYNVWKINWRLDRQLDSRPEFWWLPAAQSSILLLLHGTLGTLLTTLLSTEWWGWWEVHGGRELCSKSCLCKDKLNIFLLSQNGRVKEPQRSSVILDYIYNHLMFLVNFGTQRHGMWKQISHSAHNRMTMTTHDLFVSGISIPIMSVSAWVQWPWLWPPSFMINWSIFWSYTIFTNI